MRRRDVISLLGSLLGAVAAWPLAAHAQQPGVPVIGFLNPHTPGTYAPFVAAFRQGLKEVGYVEGQNVAIEYRWAEGRNDRLPALLADLVRLRVAVIAATGGDAPALAAKAATATTPIIVNTGVDPVKLGLIAGLSRPGGNITAVCRFNAELLPKRLELLREAVPGAAMIAFLVNPTNPSAERTTRDVQAAAHSLGLQLLVLRAGAERDIDTAFAAMVEQRVGALLITTDSFFNSRREQLAALTLRHGLPAIFTLREFAVAGGLMSYGGSLADVYRQIGSYAGKILKGAKPADLPVLQSTKVELVINLKTAKALGLTIPLPLLGRADEVIE